MPAFDFPASPTVNQIYSENGRSYRWTGVYWKAWTPIIADCNVIPNYMVPHVQYQLVEPPRNFSILFNTADALHQVNNRNGIGTGGFLSPHSVTFVDETGSGGKAFMRVVSGNSTSWDHSVLHINANLGDGTYQILARNSGTQPGSSQSHGVSILVRADMTDVSGTDDAYSLGHIKYGGTDRCRMRLINNGSATVLDGVDTDPPFLHNEWFWAEFIVNGDSFEGRYWQEGDPRPRNRSADSDR